MKARFHPQAWVDDYAMAVDTEGPIEWEVGAVPDTMQDDEYESDDLRFHENAPAWVKNWSGPFYIELLRDEVSTIDPVTDERGAELLGMIAWNDYADDDEKTIIRCGMTPVTLLAKVGLVLADMNGDEIRGFSAGLNAANAKE